MPTGIHRKGKLNLRCGGTIAAAAILAMLLASCSGGNHNSPPTFSIQPPTANVATGQVQPFQAHLNGTVVTSPVSWQVNGIAGGNSTVGTISGSGIYTAPSVVPSPANVTITAMLQGNSSQTATAMAIVGPFVSISPNFAVVETYGSQQFSATVTGAANTAVTWQVNCSQGGSACGAISQSGLYLAPNSVPVKSQQNSAPSADTPQVTAVPAADPRFAVSISAEIVSLNQQTQSAPIQLGASGSNANSTCFQGGIGSCPAGTLGALLTRGGTQYILSDGHVLAFTSAGGTVGDPIVQPGLLDTNPECDTTKVTTVGNLSQFTNFQSDPVDVGMAQVAGGVVDPSGAIVELGATVANGVPQPGAPAQGSGITASVNELVAKSGRATGLTCSSIEAIAVSANVQRQSFCSNSTFTANSSGLVTVDGMGFSAGGDSGSLLVDANTAQPVALLVADSDDGNTTFGTPVSDVLNTLKDSNGNVPTFVGGAPHAVAACSLPAPAAAVALTKNKALAADIMRNAEEVAKRNAPGLLSIRGVMAVGVGQSLDSLAEPAIILFVKANQTEGLLPNEIEGVRTRVIGTERPEPRGLLNAEETNSVEKELLPGQTRALPGARVEAAIVAKEKSVARWMKDPAIQGVGVGSSLASPGEPAIIFYILEGRRTASIPAIVEGFRTRIKQTTSIWAGNAHSRDRGNCTGDFSLLQRHLLPTRSQPEAPVPYSRQNVSP